MSNPELDIIAEEIIQAINQGRIQEAARKAFETLDDFKPGHLTLKVEPNVGRYDYQRFSNLLYQLCKDNKIDEDV